jgi:hypothetical protein
MFGLGCSTTTQTSYTLPDTCLTEDGQESSLILKTIKDPKAASIVLQFANLEALKHNLYNKEQVEQVLDTAEYMINQDAITFRTLIGFIRDRCEEVNGLVGSEIFVLSQYIDVLDVGVEISPCDKDLLIRHINKQRVILEMVD